MKRMVQVVCWLFLLSGLAVAQTGTLSGIVQDQSGAVIPGVQITVANPATSYSRSAITNERGSYVIPELPAGSYDVTTELVGFKTESRSGVELQVNSTLTLNFKMQVGEVSEKVLVEASAPLVQSETSSVGEIVDNKKIVELPLNGRNFEDLAVMVPAVDNAAQGSGNGFRGGIPVAGTREEMTDFTLDGVDIVSNLVKAISFKPSIDMLQEFKVQTSTYSAEYGRSAGGQVVATTKSGTNQIHGTVYEFIRNSVFDAKNLFDPPGPTPGYKRNNFGFTLGGPIVKNRTFFFGNYEGLIFRQAQTRRANVPTAAMVSGNFSALATTVKDPVTGTPFQGNIIPANRINPVGANIANAYPLPNLAGVIGEDFVSTPNDKRNIEQFTVKIDHQLSSKDHISGRFSFANDYEDDPFDYFSGITNLPGYGRLDSQRAMSAVIADTRVFSPTVVGDFRIGYNRFKQDRIQEQTCCNIPLQWGISGTTTVPANFGYPAVEPTGFDYLGKTNLPTKRVDPIYMVIGSLTVVHGNHTVKFGGDVNQYGTMRLNNGGGLGTFTFTGQYSGNPFADVLLGYPAKASRSLGDTRNPMWNESYSLYMQDDWKFSPRLTFNLGARYEFETPFRSTDNRLVRFNPLTGNVEITGNPSTRRDIGSVLNPAGPNYNSELAQEFQNVPIVNLGHRYLFSFENHLVVPRVGLAYRVLDSGRLVLRTGYGIFINELLGQFGQSGWNTFPYFISQTFNGAVSTPNINIQNPFPASLATATLNVSSVTPTSRAGYVQNWNFGFQLQPWTDTLVDVTYAGSASTKLVDSRNINQPPICNCLTSVASRRPFQGYGNISYQDSVSSANFNSLQMRFEKRYSKGLTLAAAFTYSKSLDTVGSGSGDSGAPDNYNIRGTMYGPDSADQKLRLVTSYVYDLPFGAGKRYLAGAHGVGGWFVSGWEISGINNDGAGRPFTVSVKSDNSNTGSSGSDRPMLIGNPYLPRNQRSASMWFNPAAFTLAPKGSQGNLGRNTLTGPPHNEPDISFIKNSPYGDQGNIQFRAEIFNFVNHPSLDLPNRYIDASNVGSIPTAGGGEYGFPSRQIQFAVKIVF